MLDTGFFRIGSEGYAEENETYGLATIRKDHVTCGDGVVHFVYEAKGGVEREQSLPTRTCSRWSGRSSVGAAAARSCWPTRPGAAGWT